MTVRVIRISNADHHENIDEAALFKTSVDPPQKLDSSAIVFSSPKKKDLKHRRRKVDADRIEERRKRKSEFAQTRKFQSEKDVELIQPYGTLLRLLLDWRISQKEEEVQTPQKDCEYSALTNFAHSLLEKMSRKEDGESNASNNDYISGKTRGPTTESGK